MQRITGKHLYVVQVRTILPPGRVPRPLGPEKIRNVFILKIHTMILPNHVEDIAFLRIIESLDIIVGRMPHRPAILCPDVMHAVE